MSLRPRSLFGRLLALSLAATLAALLVAGFAIGGVLERFMTASLDDRLGDKLIALSGVVRKDGSIDRDYAQRFETLRATDADWRVEAPGGTIGSATVAGVPGISEANDQQLGPIAGYAIGPPRPNVRDGPRRGREDAPRPPVAAGSRPFEGRLRDGARVHGRWDEVPTDRGPARIAVAVSRDAIDRPLRAALTPLALSLLALAAALALATFVQLRLGLRPLTRLSGSVAAIRSGRVRSLPADQPAELAPLATELNALVAQNEKQLANARGHVANLAHGIKTPLATLALELREPGRDPDGALAEQVARIDRAVSHHLGRARADSAGGARAHVALASTIEGLVAALARIHADRAVAATVTVAPELHIATDPHDLDEMLGNLLDNAWRFATSRIAIDAAAQDGVVRITIADDGPGIPAALRDAALQPGRRLDESGDGHGFGLSIARELAELHGGRLILAEAVGGGLVATVELSE